MCNLYTIGGPTNRMIIRIIQGQLLDWLPEEPRMIHAFDRPTAPIILGDGSCVPASWTYQPPASTDLPEEEQKEQNRWRSLTFNTIGEEMYSKRTWKEPALERRCLVPALSYTEHQHRTKGNLKTKIRVPYRMHFPEDEPFCFAGLYKYYPEEHLYRFSIITTLANKRQRFVHNSKGRQPVTIPKTQYAEYIDADTPDKMYPFLMPREDDGFIAELGVGKDGNAPENPPPPPEFDDSPIEMPVMVLK